MINCTCSTLRATDEILALLDVPSEPRICEYCTEMLWAAEMEARVGLELAALGAAMTERLTDDEVERVITEAVEREVASQGCLDESQVEGLIDNAISNIDYDDITSGFVSEDDMPRLVEEALSETMTDDGAMAALATGITSSFMRRLGDYATVRALGEARDEVSKLRERVAVLEAAMAPRPGLLARVRQVFTR